MKALVLIPTFNAQNYILEIIWDLQKKVPEVDLLVIDQGSDDRTVDLLSNNNINHLSFSTYSTYRNSLKLGIEYAYKMDYDSIIEYNYRSNFKANHVRALYEEFLKSRTDIIQASRFVKNKPSFKMRRQSPRLLRAAIYFFTKIKMTDPKLNLRLLSRDAMHEFRTAFYWSPGPETIPQLTVKKFTYKEVEIELDQGMKKNRKSYFGDIIETWEYILSIMLVQPFRQKAKKGDK